MDNPNLIDKLTARLSPPGREALVRAVAAAVEARLSLYLVGGSVRDLLLGRPTIDVDLVVEGDAPPLARRIAEVLAARCLVHPAFGTATVKLTGFAFDIATARAESYARPGALPTVRPAGLRDDLARRDFTINAMALSLTGPARGELVDPFGGREDLRRGLVRLLHDRSFVDDATRILRALRYEARLRFRLEESTLDRLRRDVGYLATISGARLRRELLRTLAEPEPEEALLRAMGLGVLAAVHPALSFDAGLAAAFAEARRQVRAEQLPLVYLALLASRWSEGEAEAVAARLSLTKAQWEAAAAMPRLRSLAPALAAAVLRPSRATDLLSPYPQAALWAFALTADAAAGDRARQYLRSWRYVKPSLDGDALLAMGASEGPALGELLRRLRAAKLDGRVSTREEEEAFVRAALAEAPNE
ncbi:MAG: CCA tRNA nucleotidyltransferase [Dehalococcoidia bacterium]